LGQDVCIENKKNNMARRKKRGIMSYFKIPTLNLDEDTKKGIYIIIILALGFIAFLGLFGKSGLMGEYISTFMLWAFGWGRFILPLVFLSWGYMLYDDERFELRGSSYFGFTVMFLSLHLFFSLLIDRGAWDLALADGRGGGQIGFALAGFFITIMGFLSSIFVSLGLILISMLIIFDTSLKNLIGQESFVGKLFYPFHYLIAKIFPRKEEEVLAENEESEEESDHNEEEENNENEDEEEEGEESEDNEDEEESEENDEDEEEGEDEEGDDGDEEETEEEEVVPRRPMPAPVEKVWWQEPTGIEIGLPLRLLNIKKGKPTSGDIEGNKEKIRKTLEDFGIRVEMKGISVGPTVTQYTFRPADGVKLSKITNLSNDLALSLAAESVRIEAPIPGKPLVGIEVPNFNKAMVGLREILGSEPFKERKKDSMLALGKDVSGKPWLADITTMPHLLVAGTTGSGKSVCLNTIIISLMYQNDPDALRFIMVDPKRVELTPYDKTPYLLTPVITDIKKTVNALKWCLVEMEKRYDILKEAGNKNIQTYNDSHEIKMPYIVFIIDELADLMVTAAKEIEGSIIRLAQMSRAVGIHLVLATQRPSVNVITGLIKANMPSRIAFAVASSTDSRTILDSQGAEKLIGRGDMLFMNAETPKPVRLQGAYLSEDEINKISAFIKSKGRKMKYVDDVTEVKKVAGLAGAGSSMAIEDADDLLADARDIVVSTGKASTTYLQRRMRVGYSRAASILDQLEELGIIGPSKGSKPRDVLMSKQQLAALDSQGISGVSLHDMEESEAPESYLGESPDVPPVMKKKNREEDENEEEEIDEEDDDTEIFREDEEEQDEEEQDEEEVDEEEKRRRKKKEEDEMFFAR
jgi:S-DNA-T family DNA segregation ATPase FtsK/SpoIIIE